MAKAYEVNYNDKRFTQVESQKNAAIKESNKTYDNMLNQSDKYFQSQIDAVKDYGETQKQNQQAETDFTIEKIEQEKDQVHKDYLKEQSAAYVDWQKQSNQYGTNAEQMAASGMAHTGYSESSQVAMYNQYQNRVATAREAYNTAVLNYNNSITEARLQNNSLLAEIAADTLEKSLKLALEGFQYKNELVDKKASAKRELEKDYYNRRQDVLTQINYENSTAEQIRQYNTSLAEEKRQFNQNYNLKLKEFNESIRQFNVEIARLKAKDAAENKARIQQLEMQKQELQLKRDQLKEEKRQFDKSYALQKKTVNSSSGSGSGSGNNNKPQDDTPTNFTTYEKAAAYMKKIGVATGDGGLMTKNEWLRRRSSGSKGMETQYSSYSEYLNAFVAWRKENPMK